MARDECSHLAADVCQNAVEVRRAKQSALPHMSLAEWKKHDLDETAKMVETSHKSRSPFPSLRDMLDSLDNAKDFIVGATTASRASWRMFKPFPGSQTQTWGEIMLEQLNLDAARGVVASPEEYIQRLDAIPDETGKRINYTELAEFSDGMRTFSEGALNLTPLALQLYGQSVQDTRPETARNLFGAGGTLDGLLNIRQGFSQAYSTLQGADWLGRMLHSPFGKPLILIQGIVGAVDYVNGARRLVTDPTIAPGDSKDAWTERVGVATQAIGGAFLTAGAAVALFGGPPGVAVGTVLLTAGVVFEGAGLVMQHWGWITETTKELFNRP